MQLSVINKLVVHTIVIYTLLVSAPVFGDSLLKFDNLWIPESYKEKIKNTDSETDLISKGLAIIIPNPKIEQSNLYKLEELARREQLGLWSNEQYKIKTPHTIAGYKDSFQIVDGTVLNTALRKGKLYLNFGDDWKTDFTVIIVGNALKELKKENTEPKYWIGQSLRFRGWVEIYNGAMIKVTDLSQVSPIVTH